MRQDVTSSWTPAIHYFNCSVSRSFPLWLKKRRKKKKRGGKKKKEKKTPSSYSAFTVLVDPSQLQSVMIRSLINATGKERSYPGKLKTSRYLGLNNALIKLHFHLSGLLSSSPLCDSISTFVWSPKQKHTFSFFPVIWITLGLILTGF